MLTVRRLKVCLLLLLQVVVLPARPVQVARDGGGGVVGGHDDVPQLGRLVLSLDLADVAHHDVDEGVLDEGEKHEDGAGRHEDVNRLYVGRREKRRERKVSKSVYSLFLVA